MYPPVRQFESSELYRRLVEKDHERELRGERGLPFGQRAWLVATALVVLCLVGAVYAAAA